MVSSFYVSFPSLVLGYFVSFHLQMILNLVVPAISSIMRMDEISHIETWAWDNNLKLNLAISKDPIIQCARKTQQVVAAASSVYEHGTSYEYESASHYC